MLKAQRSVPYFARGPDPTRCYARDKNRWSIVEGTGKDEFVVRVFTKKGWGRAETLSASLIPFVTFLLFGFIAFRMFLTDQESALDYFFVIALVCSALVVLLSVLVFSEVSYFNHVSSSPLTIFEDGEFSIGDDKSRISMTSGAILRYTLHYPAPATQGACTQSELDLVLQEGSKVVAVYKIMAHQGSGCWRHARHLSRLSSIPLKRIALQANGQPFPPALRN